MFKLNFFLCDGKEEVHPLAVSASLSKLKWTGVCCYIMRFHHHIEAHYMISYSPLFHLFRDRATIGLICQGLHLDLPDVPGNS